MTVTTEQGAESPSREQVVDIAWVGHAMPGPSRLGTSHPPRDGRGHR